MIIKKKKKIVNKIVAHNQAAIKFYLHHRPALAARETKKSLILIEKLKKIEEENLMIYQTNDFLIGNSSITRTLKKKNVKK